MPLEVRSLPQFESFVTIVLKLQLDDLFSDIDKRDLSLVLRI